MSGGSALEPVDRELPVADGGDLNVFVREGQLDDPLDRDAVVGKKKPMGHEAKPVVVFIGWIRPHP